MCWPGHTQCSSLRSFTDGLLYTCRLWDWIAQNCELGSLKRCFWQIKYEQPSMRYPSLLDAAVVIQHLKTTKGLRAKLMAGKAARVSSLLIWNNRYETWKLSEKSDRRSTVGSDTNVALPCPGLCRPWCFGTCDHAKGIRIGVWSPYACYLSDLLVLFNIYQ